MNLLAKLLRRPSGQYQRLYAFQWQRVSNVGQKPIYRRLHKLAPLLHDLFFKIGNCLKVVAGAADVARYLGTPPNSLLRRIS